MPRPDGFPEDPYEEAHVSALDLRGITGQHFEFGNRRMLTKSSSISASNARKDSAKPRFPAPLLASVNSLKSSPASSKPGTRDIADGRATCVDRVASESKRLENMKVSNGNYSSVNRDLRTDEQDEASTLSPIFSRRGLDRRHVTRRRVEAAATATLTVCGGTEAPPSHSLGARVESSHSAKGTCRYRSRTDPDTSDSVFLRPAKSQRRAATERIGYDHSNGDEHISNVAIAQECGGDCKTQFFFQANGLRVSDRVRGVSHLPDKHRIATAAKLRQRQSVATGFSVVKLDSKIQDDGQLHDKSRRGLPKDIHSRQSFGEWLNEIRGRPRKCVTPTEGSNFPGSPSPRPTASIVRWPLRLNRRLLSWHIAINLLVVVCLSLLLYSVAQHQQIVRLQKENAMLKGRVLVHCKNFKNVERRDMEVDQSSGQREPEVSSNRNIRKLLFCVVVTVTLVHGSFMAKRGSGVSYFFSNGSAEEEVSISKQVAYFMDVLFSTHSYAKAVALLLATLLLIGFGGFSLWVVSDITLINALWLSWTYVADSGNHADSVGVGPRIVAVSISIGGMLIFALMLGLISDAISEKVDSLRKGKSEVIESNHTLILGWSDKLGSLLNQLAIANQSLGGGVVVVLAEREKEEMELDIAKLEFDFMGTTVICRSGSPLLIADLKKVSVSKARSIIVLAEVENADQSDARALRVVLSLMAVKEGLRGHIVVELCDLDNEHLVKLVGEEVVETVVAHDVIGRLMIQCARQPGLAQIWGDILGFDNAEFYLKLWPQLNGMRFEDVLVSFPEAIPCGLKVAAEEGKIVLNPEDDYILQEGDEVLVIAEDDDTYMPAPLPQIRRGALPDVIPPPKHPEKILFCGWRRDIHDMIKVLDAFLPSGSELWIFSDVPIEEREKKLLEGNLETLTNIKLEHREGNSVIRRHLESLPLQIFDSILILADEKLEETVVMADSRSIATLLLIRDIQAKRLPIKASGVGKLLQPGFTQSSWIGEMQRASDQSIIISEILDSRTKHLISVSKIGDYVLSNELVSMALAMVAEEKQINRVLEELFAEQGNELRIQSAEFYLYDQEELSFFEIMIRARQRQEIMIGYRQASQERAIINPPDKISVKTWSIRDLFVVLAWKE